jgi:hypothetical protein
MVYFIHYPEANAIKIGYSADPGQRLRSLRTACPGKLILLGTSPGNQETEAAWHRHYAGRRLQGEWFRCDPRMIKEIEQTIDVPLKLWGRTVTDVYLAGKITGNRWRDDLFHRAPQPFPPDSLIDTEDAWLTPKCISVPHDTRLLNYRGPFWFDFCRGHNTPSPGAHAYGDEVMFDHCQREYATRALLVRDRCLAGIDAAHLVFAWIDDDDCHGTLAELGYAYALKRRNSEGYPLIAVSSPSRSFRDNLWFVHAMADFVNCSDGPLNAWDTIWGCNEERPLYRPGQDKVRRGASGVPEAEYAECGPISEWDLPEF